MKYDPEIDRQILLKVESFSDTALRSLHLEGYPREQVLYQCDELIKADFINGKCISGQRMEDCAVGSLTRQGSALLNDIRDEANWKKVKTYIEKNHLTLIAISLAMLHTIIRR